MLREMYEKYEFGEEEEEESESKEEEDMKAEATGKMLSPKLPEMVSESVGLLYTG